MRTARTLVWLALLLLTAPAAAQTAAPKAAALTGTLTMASGRARTLAPIWLDVELTNHTAALIEGQLDLGFFDGRELLGRYRGWDMALTNGAQRYRIMLPQPAARGPQSTLDVSMRFITAKGTYDLGWQMVSVAAPRERACVLAVGSRNLGSSGPAGMVRSLQVERYDPDRAASQGRRLTTFPALIAPDDFPVDPLGYCPYDIVLLPADAFGLVRQRQLEALARWVEAGGSVCVLPGAGLKPYHVDWLNELTGRDAATFALLADGHLSAGEGMPAGGIGLFRCGLGRAVIATQTPEALDSAEWRGAVAFLWKLRSDRHAAFTRDGFWDPKPAQPTPDGGSAPVQVPAGTRASLPPEAIPIRPLLEDPELPRDTMGVLPLASAANFYEPLMPESIRVIPFGWIVVLLAALVVAVGPGDYVLLGLVKRRKLTWVLFPALCIGFAGGTVLMARYCLGTNDHRGALVFVDVGRGGRVLRTSRYEVVYAAREFVSTTQYRDALAAAVGPSGYASDYGRYYGGNYYEAVQSPEAGPFELAGRVPAGYQMRRLTRQWTPQLTRTFSVGGKALDLGLRWDDVTLEDLQSPLSRRIAEKLLGTEQFDGQVFVVNAGAMRAVRSAGLPAMNSFLERVTARPAEGLFRFLSQVAPTGSGDFEDLSMTDPSDPSQWVLIAVKREGDDFIICRRFYCADK